mgnify:CR=1 FL=1|jgi:hypothetical protein
MNLGQITVITPPDKLFNLNISYLLVSPSLHVKHQFQSILSKCLEDLNVFIYENDENDIDWLLSVSQIVDAVIIDIDNCNPITKQFITFLLAQPNTHYITSDELTPYNLISKNRIFNLDWIVEQFENPLDDIDENEDDDDSESED